MKQARWYHYRVYNLKSNDFIIEGQIFEILKRIAIKKVKAKFRFEKEPVKIVFAKKKKLKQLDLFNEG